MTTPISFEFFPPKSEEGQQKLSQVWENLKPFQPEYVSVTYGAGGSTREGTEQAVLAAFQAGFDVAPHLSFGQDDEQTVLALLERYQNAGVKRLVLLRGDAPSGIGATKVRYASELVAFVKQHFGNHFHIEVAAYPEVHPQAENFETDLQFFKQKMQAGADAAITQYFYSADSYFYFVERCQKLGITQPIVPGIMPITNYTRLKRFSDMCGAEIPRWVSKQLQAYGDDSQAIQAFGHEVVLKLSEQLIAGGAPALHIYTLNQTGAAQKLCQDLGK